MHFKHLIFMCFVSLAGAPASAQTERAFIVGVSDYDELPDLTRPLEDAQGYAGVFSKDLGFSDYVLLENPTRAQFAVGFGRFLESIAPGDIVVFAFSGHGWSDGSENYLAFKDSPQSASEYELKASTPALAREILQSINARSPAMVLAIIDACRDNPFDTGTKGAFEKGLVRIDADQGTMVVYSAGERQKALDRLGDADPEPYSLFTRKLLPRLKNADVPLMLALDDVREAVESEASRIGHRQRPAIYSSVSMKFCFSGNCLGGPDNSTLPGNSAEDTLLNFALQSESREVLEAFLKQFPASRHKATVEQVINGLNKADTLASNPPSKLAREEAALLLDEVFGRPPAKPVSYPATALVGNLGATLSCKSPDGNLQKQGVKFGSALVITGENPDRSTYIVQHSQYGTCSIPKLDVALN